MVAEILQPFLSLLSDHPYLFIFVGMIFAGELVLLPAIYLVVTGCIELAYVILVAIVATTISDFVWYYLGRRFPVHALGRLPGKGTSKVVGGLDRLFAKNGSHLVFLSKFVCGTRVAVQILAGVHDMPLRTYLLANTLGVAAFTLALSAIAWSIAGTAQRFEDFVYGAKIAFGVFVLVAAIGYFVVARVARRKWSQ